MYIPFLCVCSAVVPSTRLDAGKSWVAANNATIEIPDGGAGNIAILKQVY